jgi:ribosomal protein S4
MLPYFRKKKKFIFFYKNLFFTKQKLKNFYGGLKEYQMRNIFKKVWNKEQFYRTNIFVGALEQRIGMIFFRMRLIPTIFACNQLIKHQGILVNEELITFYNYKVNLGDIISIPKLQWDIFFEFLFDRLLNRSFGQGLVL